MEITSICQYTNITSSICIYLIQITRIRRRRLQPAGLFLMKTSSTGLGLGCDKLNCNPVVTPLWYNLLTEAGWMPFSVKACKKFGKLLLTLRE